MEPTLPQQPTQQPTQPPMPQPQPGTGGYSFNSTPPIQAPKSSKKWIVILIVLLVAALGVIGWLLFLKDDTDNNQQQTTSNTEQNQDTEEDTDQTTQPALSYQSQKVTSGKDRFTIEIPQGWPEIVRPLDADHLIVMGTTQPTYTAGKAVTVKDLSGFGTDAPSVFTVLVYDAFSEPEGTVTDFSIPNNENALTGKKYTLVYTDTVDGLGGHKKGDKFYNYRFNLKDGNTLYISYSVYSDDMNDQVSLIDEVVKSIVIKN